MKIILTESFFHLTLVFQGFLSAQFYAGSVIGKRDHCRLERFVEKMRREVTSEGGPGPGGGWSSVQSDRCQVVTSTSSRHGL